MAQFPNFKKTGATTAAPANIGLGGGRLMAVQIQGGSGNSKVEFYDSADNSGTVLLTLNCLAASNQFIDLSNLGGVFFTTGIYCLPTGTGCIVYAWVD